MMFVLALGPFGSAHSRVMTHVRRSGALTREELARRTGLSPSTVARTIASLSETGLLRERPDLVPERIVGRPSVPVEVDGEQFVTLGVHVGRRVATVALGDLRGRVLARTAFDHGELAARDLARRAAGELTTLLGSGSALANRIALSAGLVAPWGDVAYSREELGAELSGTLGLEVETWELVPAIAAAEYIARPDDLPGSTLYLYARDTVGFVMANERPWGMEIARVGRLSHYPAGGHTRCHCGRVGCLETVASEHAVAQAAVAADLIGTPDLRRLVDTALAGNDTAHTLLCDRAGVLGQVAAVVRDMVHPDRIVLCGQGFTSYPPALDVMRSSFRRHTATAGEIDISFTRVPGEVQAVAAGTVALRRVYDDPMAALEEVESGVDGRGDPTRCSSR